MLLKSELFIVIICVMCFYNIQCKRGRSRGSRGSNWGRTKQKSDYEVNLNYSDYATKSTGNSNQDANNQVGDSGASKQDTSKVASSAPTALDSRYNSQPKDADGDLRNKQAINPFNSPNPQKPSGWNSGTGDQGVRNNGWNVASSHFHHPGHNQGSNLPTNYPISYPTQTYQHVYPNTDPNHFYGIGDGYSYGYGHQSKPEQQFQGYRSTSNIGIIPPQGVDARQYYNNLSGLENEPVFAQAGSNGGLFEKLFNGARYTGNSYGYGRYGSPFGGLSQNAYRNVLAGLFMWNIVHGLTTFRYNVYNYYNYPDVVSRNISLPAAALTTCQENTTVLCAPPTAALCTSNNTIFCVAPLLDVVSCGGKLTVPCVKSDLPCINKTDSICVSSEKKEGTIGLPCVGNVTVTGDLKDTKVLERIEMLRSNQTSFCVTSLAIPQVETRDGYNKSCATTTPSEVNVNPSEPCRWRNVRSTLVAALNKTESISSSTNELNLKHNTD